MPSGGEEMVDALKEKKKASDIPSDASPSKKAATLGSLRSSGKEPSGSGAQDDQWSMTEEF